MIGDVMKPEDQSCIIGGDLHVVGAERRNMPPHGSIGRCIDCGAMVSAQFGGYWRRYKIQEQP